MDGLLMVTLVAAAIIIHHYPYIGGDNHRSKKTSMRSAGAHRVRHIQRGELQLPVGDGLGDLSRQPSKLRGPRRLLQPRRRLQERLLRMLHSC